MLSTKLLSTSLKAQRYGFSQMEALVISFKAHTAHLEINHRLALWSLITGLPAKALH